jgi:hypothetical protein
MMTKTPDTAPAPRTREEAAQAFCETFQQAAWQSALRFVADLEGAPQRCTRRACRKEGSCRLEWEEGTPVTCGGGMTTEMIVRASTHAYFAALMAVAHVEEIVLPEREKQRAELWKAFGVPLDT